MLLLIALLILISNYSGLITTKNIRSNIINRTEMRCFYVFLLSVSIASGLDLTHEDYKRYWQEWKSFYGKSYKSDLLDNVHFAVWKDNLKVSKFYFAKIADLIYNRAGNPVPPPRRKGNARNRRLSPLLAIISYCIPRDARGSHAWIRDMRIFSVCPCESQKKTKSRCCFRLILQVSQNFNCLCEDIVQINAHLLLQNVYKNSGD